MRTSKNTLLIQLIHVRTIGSTQSSVGVGCYQFAYNYYIACIIYMCVMHNLIRERFNEKSTTTRACARTRACFSFSFLSLQLHYFPLCFLSFSLSLSSDFSLSHFCFVFLFFSDLSLSPTNHPLAIFFSVAHSFFHYFSLTEN